MSVFSLLSMFSGDACSSGITTDDVGSLEADDVSEETDDCSEELEDDVSEDADDCSDELEDDVSMSTLTEESDDALA